MTSTQVDAALPDEVFLSYLLNGVLQRVAQPTSRTVESQDTGLVSQENFCDCTLVLARLRDFHVLIISWVSTTRSGSPALHEGP